MVTKVNRLQDGGDALTTGERPPDGRPRAPIGHAGGKPGRRRRRGAPGFVPAAAVVAAASGAPEQARAAASLAEPAATQMTVGTLPLLMSLGIGIAIAVLAVVAFLQLTAKGKEYRALRDLTDSARQRWDDEEPAHEGAEGGDRSGGSGVGGGESRPADGRRGGMPSANGAARDVDVDVDVVEDGTMPVEYTIPLSPMADGPPPAQAAEDGSIVFGVEGKFAGRSFRIDGKGLAFGRDSAQCSVVFPLDAGEISRKHCTLKYEADRGVFLLVDHGSSNGTFLDNGDRLEPHRPYELRAGQGFALSGRTNRFEVRR